MQLHKTWLLLLLLAGLQLSESIRDIHNDHDLMPGWMGSDYESPTYTAGESAVRRIEVLNEDARVYRIRGFLTPEECDAIIKGAEPRLERSAVQHIDHEKNISEVVYPEFRTSYSMFFKRGETDIMKAVEERIAAWSLLPVSHGEAMQVLRYGAGQKYDAHMDYLYYAEGNANGGPRCATVLAYLDDVEEGGETYFPNLPAHPSQDKNMSECARNHLAIRPRKGDAILFHSIAPSGQVDVRSLHGSCPVIKGTKWAMTKWIHVGVHT